MGIVILSDKHLIFLTQQFMAPWLSEHVACLCCCCVKLLVL